MSDDMETYDDLAAMIAKLSPEQRKQKVQVVNSSNDDSVPSVMQPCYGIGTVKDLFETATEDGSHIEDHVYVRDSYDGKHHSDAVVMLIDSSDYEDLTVYDERRTLLKAMQKIGLDEAGTDAKEIARVALDKIAHKAEKRKEKMLKECC